MTARVNLSLDPVVLLYAIRYCLARHTYARIDGLWLIREHADLLIANGWANTIRDDLDYYYGSDMDEALDALRDAERQAIEADR